MRRLPPATSINTQVREFVMSQKIDNLIKEYNQLADMDSALPIKGRYSTGLLIGFRPWVYTMIANLRRKPKKNHSKKEMI